MAARAQCAEVLPRRHAGTSHHAASIDALTASTGAGVRRRSTAVIAARLDRCANALGGATPMPNGDVEWRRQPPATTSSGIWMLGPTGQPPAGPRRPAACAAFATLCECLTLHRRPIGPDRPPPATVGPAWLSGRVRPDPLRPRRPGRGPGRHGLRRVRVPALNAEAVSYVRRTRPVGHSADL